MKIKNSDDLRILRQDMVNAIQDLDYFALGYFIQVIENVKLDRLNNFSNDCILHLCHTGEDLCDEILAEYPELLK